MKKNSDIEKRYSRKVKHRARSSALRKRHCATLRRGQIRNIAGNRIVRIAPVIKNGKVSYYEMIIGTNGNPGDKKPNGEEQSGKNNK